MVDMLLKSLPDQIEFDVPSLRSIMMQTLVYIQRLKFVGWFSLRPPEKERSEANAMNRKRKVGFSVKVTDLVWTEVPNIKIVVVNQGRFGRVPYAEVTNT